MSLGRNLILLCPLGSKKCSRDSQQTCYVLSRYFSVDWITSCTQEGIFAFKVFLLLIVLIYHHYHHNHHCGHCSHRYYAPILSNSGQCYVKQHESIKRSQEFIQDKMGINIHWYRLDALMIQLLCPTILPRGSRVQSPRWESERVCDLSPSIFKLSQTRPWPCCLKGHWLIGSKSHSRAGYFHIISST